MKRIIINERDVTVSNNPELVTDVVFVPGFAIGGTADPFVPKYCSTLTEFQEYFGNRVPTFGSDQEYPQFSEAAIPVYEGEEAIMFPASSPDPGYIYASEILSAGLPIVYIKLNENNDPVPSEAEGQENVPDITVANMYTKLAEIFNSESADCPLLDKNEFNIKYLTSGGYPTFEYGDGVALVNLMTSLAYNRGDCVALIDHTNNPMRSLTSTETTTQSVYNSVVNSTMANPSYGAIFTPWINVSASVAYNNNILTLEMPGSFAYLVSLAESLRNNANWLAIAGVTRGRVPGLTSLNITSALTNTIAESYTNLSGVSINPITNIRPYGYCIWGNKTLLNAGAGNGFATSFLNIRNLVSDVKKQAYVAAKSSLFEQNTDILWVNFKSLLMPMLDQMVSGAGLKSYKIIKLPGSDREVIKAKIVLVPVYAVEQFIIDIAITDEEVEVEEEL